MQHEETKQLGWLIGVVFTCLAVVAVLAMTGVLRSNTCRGFDCYPVGKLSSSAP